METDAEREKQLAEDGFLAGRYGTIYLELLCVHSRQRKEGAGLGQKYAVPVHVWHIVAQPCRIYCECILLEVLNDYCSCFRDNLRCHQCNAKDDLNRLPHGGTYMDLHFSG